MSETPMRASHMDRQRIIEALQEQPAVGRLNLDEFSERVARAYAATTRSELDDLVADLPVTLDRVDGSRSGTTEPAVPPLDRDAAVIWVAAAPLLCVLTVLTVIGLMAGSPAALAVIALAGFAVWRWSPGGLAAVGRRLRPSAPGGHAGHRNGPATARPDPAELPPVRGRRDDV